MEALMRGSHGTIKSVSSAFLIVLLTACGGGGGDDGTTPGVDYNIGGQLSGLTAGQGMTVQNNGRESLNLRSNGAFGFSNAVAANGEYAVTVRTQPAGQRCSVGNGIGRATANVSNVKVRCANLAPNTFTIGGTVNGLGASKTVVLQNNGVDELTISTNGGFTFATAVVTSSTYAITIRTQPTGQTCTLRQASGTAVANVSSVALMCQDVTAGIVKPLYLADTYREDRTGLLAQANTQGANGYAYLTGLAASTTEFINLYVKDIGTTYLWEMLDLTSSAAALQAQLNAQGARGFAHSTFLTSGVVYVKDTAGLAPFSYELLPSQATSAAFLTQADAQGARGFFFLGDFAIGGGTVAIYSKDGSNARYSYSLQTPTDTATPETFVTQANVQGQQGFRFIGAYVYSGNPGNDAFRNVYVKDSAQTPTFEYKAQAATSGASALVTQANAEGQLGNIFYGSNIFFPNGYSQPGITRNLYFKPSGCSGTVLCRAASPL